MDNSEDIEEEKKARPENEIKPEVKSFNDEIEQKAAEMQAQHGDKFNAERFKSAAREYAEKNGNLNGISADNFVEKDKENIGNGQGKSYGLEQVNGKFIARGSDGSILEGSNFEEINDKVCADLVQHCKSQGREATIGLHSDNEEHKKTFSKNALLKHNATIIAGWPEDKQFWKNLKDEYLKDENHTLADWEKMTRRIPDDVMSRTPEERARVKKLNDAELLKAMRRGNNPYLNPQENKPQQPANALQNNNSKGKTLTAGQMKALSGRGGQSL